MRRAIRIEVERSGQVSPLQCEGPRAIVGCDAHCDVRLLPDDASGEQLALELRGDELWCIVLERTRPCHLDGALFLEARVGPGAEIELGGVTLRASVRDIGASAKPPSRSGSSTPPAVQAAALLVLGAGYYVLMGGERTGPSALDMVRDPPRLLEEEAAPCPVTEPKAALELAERARWDAESHRERAPFHLRDGLLAVPLYHKAAACYRRAGEEVPARGAVDAADAIRGWLNQELRLRHVRIERMIAQKKYDQLRDEVRRVAALVPDPTDPYARWLAAVAREVELRSATEDS